MELEGIEPAARAFSAVLVAGCVRRSAAVFGLTVVDRQDPGLTDFSCCNVGQPWGEPPASASANRADSDPHGNVCFRGGVVP